MNSEFSVEQNRLIKRKQYGKRKGKKTSNLNFIKMSTNNIRSNSKQIL